MRETPIALPVRCGPTGALLDANGFEIARFNWSDDIVYVVECINQRHREGEAREGPPPRHPQGEAADAGEQGQRVEEAVQPTGRAPVTSRNPSRPFQKRKRTTR